MPDANRQTPLYPLWVASLWSFVVAAAAGMAFRWELVSSLPVDLAVGDIRHAHSHLMLMGWATPALMACMARSWPAQGIRRADKKVAVVGWLSWILAVASFPPFLLYGYDSVAAVLSGLAILAWYGFAAVYFRATRGVRRTPAMKLWDLAVVALVVSSAGAWAVAGLMAAGVDNPLWEAATVHFFVELFGGGWLVLGVIGLMRARLDAPDTRLERVGRRLVAAGVGLVFLVGLSRQYTPEPWIVVGNVAAATVAAGLAALTWCWARRLGRWSRVVFVFLGLQIVMLAALAIPPLADWGIRSGVRILYLHVVFAGVVTLGLIVASTRLWAPRAAGSRRLWLAGILALVVTLVPLTGLWPSAASGVWTLWAALLGSVAALVCTTLACVLATRSLRS